MKSHPSHPLKKAGGATILVGSLQLQPLLVELRLAGTVKREVKILRITYEDDRSHMRCWIHTLHTLLKLLFRDVVLFTHFGVGI